MRNKILILLLFTILKLNAQLGNVIITPQKFYEEDNNYIAFDHFSLSYLEEEMKDSPLQIKKKSNNLEITNYYNTGFSGQIIKFRINKNLELKEITYEKWSDNIIAGVESKFTVEKGIISMSDNPFDSKKITSHYTLQIKEELIVEEELKKHGIKDSIRYFIFEGKFKTYNKLEVLKGYEYTKNKNEIKAGIKNKDGAYLYPEKPIEHKEIGTRFQIMEYLEKFTLNEDELKEGYYDASIIFQINSDGKIEKIYSDQINKNSSIYNKIKNDKLIMSNWIPAMINNVNVKSEIDIPIQIR